MITVFGSINLDLIGTVERLPRPGETVPGTAFATAPGGKGANQALAAALAGAPCRMVGAVGSDAFSEPALALLRAGGVDLAAVRTVDGPTGVALILVDARGENVIAVVPGANGLVAEREATALEFNPGDALVLQLEVPIASIAAAARRAQQAGVPVLLNFAPFRTEALGLIECATHLIVNETECALVAGALRIPGKDLAEQAKAIAAKHGSAVIVTLGKDGALAAAEGKIETVSALAVTALDTVGAGDTFCGYLAAGLTEGLTLSAAMALASAAGSLACTRAGAQPSVPRRNEVAAAMRGR